MPYVVTVRGPISPEQLGVTICHTHPPGSLLFMFGPLHQMLVANPARLLGME